MNLNTSGQALQAQTRRILVACIGNIFQGDDGFGVEVARLLLSRKERPFPQEVEIVDFGIRGLDLAYTLLEPYDALVLVDAVERGGVPGTLYLLELDLAEITPESGVQAAQMGLDAHSMDPAKVLAYAQALGAPPVRTLLVGCEPAFSKEQRDDSAMQMGLSKPVQAALPNAIKMVNSLVEQLLTGAEKEDLLLL